MFINDRDRRAHQRRCNGYETEQVEPRSSVCVDSKLEVYSVEKVKQVLEGNGDGKIDQAKSYARNPLREESPEQYHSAKDLDPGLSQDFKNHKFHEKQTNFPDGTNYERKRKLNLPGPNDKIWVEIDQKLDIILDQTVPYYQLSADESRAASADEEE